ncbi:hypothetical protein KA344_08595 [bacterium]|nr:hypothetical protein [bacterium]
MTISRNRLNSAFAILPVLLAGSFLLAPQALKASAGPGENPVQLRFAAMDAILHGNSKDALDLYETAIQEASQQYGDNSTFLADLYYEAGTAALDSSQFPVAERYLTLAVKINPYATMAKIKLAELYRLQERPEEASKQFRQAVQINPSPVTRQAYIRWLATNGRTPQENAIATQEALKLAMVTARSNESSRLLNLNSKSKQAATGSQMPVLPPALLAPVSKEKGASENANQNKTESKKIENAAAIKSDAKPKSTISLFPFKNVAKEQALDKEKQEKLRKQEAAKQEAQAKARLAEEREREREREKDAQARKRAVAAEKAKAEAPPKKIEAKPPVAKPVEKVEKVEKLEKVEKVEKVEKKEPKKEQPKTVAQPNIVPAPQQPFYPQMIYGVPASVQKPTGKAARTMVPPPPPMPIFPAMQPMMRPPVPNFQPPQQQQQPPVAKPKAEVKPKVEVKEQPEDKPPPMTNQSADNEAEFILDWGEVKPKGKKGK